MDSAVSSRLQKIERRDLCLLLGVWAMTGGGIWQLWHGSHYRTIRNWVPAPALFHQPIWVSQDSDPVDFWIAVAVFSIATLVLGILAIIVTVGRHREMRSFRQWSSRPPIDRSVRERQAGAHLGDGSGPEIRP